MGSVEAAVVANESVWLDANRFYEAESRYYERSDNTHKKENPHKVTSSTSNALPVTGKPSATSSGMSQSSLASEIAHARQKIQNFLKSGTESGVEYTGRSVISRLEDLEKGHEEMKKTVAKLTSDMSQVLGKLSGIEKFLENITLNQGSKLEVKFEKPKQDIQNGSSHAADDDDDDIDLFGSDEEDAAATKLKEERLQAYANKKAKKPALVAKSSVVLDVKPWDDETDLKEMEKAVRGIQTEGLVWGASKQVPLAYGIKKLQIVAIVEDEKVSIDWLQETICEIEDLVQSVDVAAFNKL